MQFTSNDRSIVTPWILILFFFFINLWIWNLIYAFHYIGATMRVLLTKVDCIVWCRTRVALGSDTVRDVGTSVGFYNFSDGLLFQRTIKCLVNQVYICSKRFNNFKYACFHTESCRSHASLEYKYVFSLLIVALYFLCFIHKYVSTLYSVMLMVWH